MRQTETPEPLCRITLHIDGAAVDITVPTDIRVAELLPALHDLAIRCGAPPRTAPLAKQLYLPDRGPVDTSNTLAELGIRDGQHVILASRSLPPPRSVQHDGADAVVFGASRAGQPSATAQQAAALGIVGLAAAMGYAVVPDAPACQRLLLGSALALTAGVLGADRDSAALIPVTLSAGLVATAALGSTLFELSAVRSGAVLAVLVLLTLGGAARIAVALSGRPTRGVDATARLRLCWFHRVLAGAAGAAGPAAVLTVAGPAWSAFAVAATLGAALLARGVSESHASTRAVLLLSGIVCSAALFVEIGRAHV